MERTGIASPAASNSSNPPAGRSQANNGVSSGSNGNSIRPRDLEVENETLQKLNFNMKLRMFYLEERLQKLNAGNVDATELQEELFQSQLKTEEKQRELDQRNVLLVKARNAIEALQVDLQMTKRELQLTKSRAGAESSREILQRDAVLRESKAQVEDLRRTGGKQLRDIAVLHNQIRELKHELSAKNSTVAALQKDLDHSQKEAHTSGTESAKLVAEVARLRAYEKDLPALRQARRDAEKQIESAERREQACTKENRELQDRVAQLKEETEELRRNQESVAKLEAEEISRLEADNGRLRQAQAVARAAEAELQRENDRLKDVLNARVNEAEGRGAALEAARREIDTLREARAVREEEITARSLLREAELRRELSERESALQRANAELAGKLTALEFSRDDLREECQRLTRAGESMESRMREAEAKRVAAESKVEEIMRAGRPVSGWADEKKIWELSTTLKSREEEIDRLRKSLEEKTSIHTKERKRDRAQIEQLTTALHQSEVKAEAHTKANRSTLSAHRDRETQRVAKQIAKRAMTAETTARAVTVKLAVEKQRATTTAAVAADTLIEERLRVRLKCAQINLRANTALLNMLDKNTRPRTVMQTSHHSSVTDTLTDSASGAWFSISDDEDVDDMLDEAYQEEEEEDSVDHHLASHDLLLDGEHDDNEDDFEDHGDGRNPEGRRAVSLKVLFKKMRRQQQKLWQRLDAKDQATRRRQAAAVRASALRRARKLKKKKKEVELTEKKAMAARERLEMHITALSASRKDVEATVTRLVTEMRARQDKLGTTVHQRLEKMHRRCQGLANNLKNAENTLQANSTKLASAQAKTKEMMFAKKKQSGAQFRHAAETVAANQKAAMILKQTEEKYQKEIDSLKHRALKAEKDASDVASQASKASADALAAQERGASMEVSLEEARKRGDVLADNVRLLRLELEEKTERLSEAEVELERLQAACEKATAWKMQLKTAFREKDRHIVDLASELQVELSEMMRKEASEDGGMDVALDSKNSTGGERQVMVLTGPTTTSEGPNVADVIMNQIRHSQAILRQADASLDLERIRYATATAAARRRARRDRRRREKEEGMRNGQGEVSDGSESDDVSTNDYGQDDLELNEAEIDLRKAALSNPMGSSGLTTQQRRQKSALVVELIRATEALRRILLNVRALMSAGNEYEQRFEQYVRRLEAEGKRISTLANRGGSSKPAYGVNAQVQAQSRGREAVQAGAQIRSTQKGSLSRIAGAAVANEARKLLTRNAALLQAVKDVAKDFKATYHRLLKVEMGTGSPPEIGTVSGSGGEGGGHHGSNNRRSSMASPVLPPVDEAIGAPSSGIMSQGSITPQQYRRRRKSFRVGSGSRIIEGGSASARRRISLLHSASVAE